MTSGVSTEDTHGVEGPMAAGGHHSRLQHIFIVLAP